MWKKLLFGVTALIAGSLTTYVAMYVSYRDGVVFEKHGFPFTVFYNYGDVAEFSLFALAANILTYTFVWFVMFLLASRILRGKQSITRS